jgi:DNA-binding MarR family transcriptional regulator
MKAEIMPDFTVDDRWLTERAVRDLAAWYHDQCPQTDMLAFETHLMLHRAYLTAAEDSPLERIAGLSRPRYNLLRLLYQVPDHRLLMNEFAQDMNVSPTNITKHVDSLVADGLVQRVMHEVDKRKTWAELTQKGAALVEKTLPYVASHVRGLYSPLNDQEKQVLTHLLAKIRLHSMSATGEEPAQYVRDFSLQPSWSKELTK